MDAVSALFDLAFFHEAVQSELLGENAMDFLRALMEDCLSVLEEQGEDAVRLKDVFGEELGEYAQKEWEREKRKEDKGKTRKHVAGEYLCAEIFELCRQHVSEHSRDMEGSCVTSYDMFHVLCAILCDDALRSAFAKHISKAEGRIASHYAKRAWIGSDFESYTEDGIAVSARTFLRGPAWDALGATPYANFNVSPVYDRESGCWQRPPHRVYRVDYDDGRVVHFGLCSESIGVALHMDGRKEHDGHDEVFRLLWNSAATHFAVLYESVPEKRPKHVTQ